MKNSKKKLTSMLGWMLILAHNGIKISEDDYSLVSKTVKEEFDGDEQGAIKYIQEKYNKYMSELKEEINND